MNNKLIERFFVTVAFLVTLVLGAGNAFAVENESSVISPYWQTDTDSYSFVAVSHPSLSGTNSEIGVVLNVLTDNGTTTFGSSVFTVSQNTTTRVFIVATNHSTINSTNVTGSSTVFITGTTAASSGSLAFTPRSSNPTTSREAGGQISNQATDITMLSYWGAIVVSSTNSGFAMEFIGDTHDSSFLTETTATRFTQVPVGLN